MLWVFLALIATFLWAWANVTDKVLRTKFLKSSIALTAAFGIISLIFSFILFLFAGVPSIPFWHLIASFLAGVALTVGLIFYLKALSIEEASRVIPLWHLSPLFTLILAVIFLNEILTPLKYLAFATILLGGFLISTKRIGNIFHISPALALMILSSFLVSISDVLVKFAYSTGIFWQTFLVFYTAISLSSVSLFVLKSARKDFVKTLVFHRYNFILLLLLSIITGFSGQILYNRAILLGPITLVSVFISFQSLFVLLIATFLSIKFPLLVKEAVDVKTIGMKLVAIVLMSFGLFLLAL